MKHLSTFIETEKRLDTLNVSNNDIEKIMQNLNTNKTHGHAKISIRMIKISGKSICKSFELIFNQCSNSGIFSLEWGKSRWSPRW